MIVPSFFVVGAQKAGTTTLHERLARHPEVRLPTIKETHFFRDAERWDRGASWYLGWFPPADEDSIVGEVDPDLLFAAEAPARMRRLVERPRLVYVFRDPLERAHSQYRMSRRRGFETLSFGDALRAESGRLAAGDRHAALHLGYMARGRYAEQLERFRDTFPDAPELLLDFHALFDPRRGAAEYERLGAFLGLRSRPSAPAVVRRANAGAGSRSRVLRNLIYRPSRLKRLGRRLVPSERGRLAIAQWFDRVNRRPEPPAVGWRDEVPSELLAEALAQIDALERASGLSLAGWPTRRAAA